MENKDSNIVTGTQDEANNLLQNGILVETDSGLLCVPLNESLLSDLNLSVEELHSVASQLILQEDNKIGFTSNPRERVHLRTYNFSFDSDGFSSECSDISSSSGRTNQPLFALTSGSLPGEHKLTMKQTFTEDDPEINTTYKPVTITSRGLLCNSTNLNAKQHEPVSFVTMHSSSDVSVNSNISDSDISVANFSSPSVIIPFCTNQVTSPVNAEAKNTLPLKRRGGWPKGRKRKPELLNLPPKAPATGYNLYLNEQRKLYKESNLAFHEITKIIGNRWSSLTLNDKKPYLAKAEEDKKRYREELHKYRQSDAYRAYLNKKRKNRLQNNILSESDMDATDEIDEEDNEELYCRTCDQWFHNLHNKKEHLQGRQHTQSVAGDMKKELGNIVNIDPYSGEINDQKSDKIEHESSSVSDSINHLVSIVAKREKEIKSLKCRLEESQLSQKALWQQLCSLTERESKLTKDLQLLKMKEQATKNIVTELLKVPTYVSGTSFHISDINDDFSEEN